MTATRSRLHPASLFTLSALAVLSVCAALVRSNLFRHNPSLASWGITFDLTITIPAIYWLTVVRSGRARAMTLAPVFVACAAVASTIVPHDQQTFLHQLRLVAAPLDLVTIGLVIRKLLEIRRSGAAANDDAEARIRRAAKAIFGDGVVAAAVAGEISIVHYALFCWRKKMAAPAATTPITVHEQSGWGSIVVCILVMFVAESIGMHLLVQLWSSKVAWTITALDLYGMMWLIGDYHALRLRPTLVGHDAIVVRHGLRWNVTIERSNIAAVVPAKAETDWKSRRTLKLALLDEPRFVIRLHQPVVAYGLAGIRKTIDSIAIRPDDAAAFERALIGD